MLSTREVRLFVSSTFAAAALLTCLAAPAAAQAAAPAAAQAAAQSGPNTGAMKFSGGLDFTNAYFFRGIRQETEGLIMYPYLDVGLTLFTGEDSLKSFGVNFGTWNSLHHKSVSGSDNPRNRKVWYESDFYTTLGFVVSGGVSVGVTYTAYTSPNDGFTTVKEVSFKFGVDDAPYLGKYAVKPYAVIATELDTGTGTGQADGGFCQGTFVSGCSGAGTYLEIGASPSYTAPTWSVAIPVKVGIGLIDYYQALFTDANGAVVGLNDKFGYFSIAGVGTLPFTKMTSKFGSWNLHGGVEFLKLGDMTTFANGDDSNQVIGTVGIGFSY
jgi:hypothetical protein